MGFLYGGIKYYLDAICVFLLFSMFPSEKIKNKLVIKLIKTITRYTGGVYYLHIPVSRYISHYSISVRNRTVKGCVNIYLTCYIICFIGNLVFGKTKLRNLFE